MDLRSALLPSLLILAAPCGFSQEPARPSSPNSPVSNEEQPGDPENKRVHISRFVIAPGQDISVPALANDSLVICLRGDSLSRIPIQGHEEKWSCGPGNTLSNRSGATPMIANTGGTGAEILVVELKDSYTINQLRVPSSELDPLRQDPRHFRMLFENVHARVLLLHLNPREGTLESQFADRLEVALTARHESITDVDGKAHEVQQEAGSVRWNHSVMYSTVNLDEKPLDKLIVELKHPFCYPTGSETEIPAGLSPSMKAYGAKVKDAIYKRWMKHMPSGVNSGDDHGFVLLQVKINPDGTITEDGLRFRMVFADGSLMEKALSAVRDASPFPPIPSDFREPSFGGRFVFLYNLPRQPPRCK